MKRALTGIFVLILMAGIGIGQTVPELVNLQGRLTDDSGNEITANTDMRFNLYDASSAGNLLLTDAHEAAGSGAVSVVAGHYNVLLGGGTLSSGVYSTIDTVFGNESTVYVEIEVHNGSGYETLSPRVQLVASPFALNALHLDGFHASDFLLAGSAATFTGASFDFGGSTDVNVNGNLDILGTWSIGGTTVSSSAADLNLLSGRNTAEIWGNDNDGTGSGLDADTLDGLDSSAFALVGSTNATTLGGLDETQFLRADATSTLTGGSLFIDNTSILRVQGNLGIDDDDISYNGGSTNFSTNGDWSVNIDQLFVDKISGRVGIGNSTPVHELDVVGATFTDDLFVGGDTPSNLPGAGGEAFFATDIEVDGITYLDGDTVIGDAAGDAFVINSQVITAPAGIEFDQTLFVDTIGFNVGIGEAPTAPLHVVEHGSFTGPGTITSSGPTVTGSGTSFSLDIWPGDMLVEQGVGDSRIVIDVQSNTSLILDEGFNGDLTSATAYDVIPSIARFVDGTGDLRVTINPEFFLIGSPTHPMQTFLAGSLDMGEDVDDFAGVEVINSDGGTNAHVGFVAENDSGTFTGLVLGGSNNSDAFFQDRTALINDGAGIILDAQADIFMATGGFVTMKLSANGDVGIGNFGSNDPVSRLHIDEDPIATSDHGLVSLGKGPFDGISGGAFVGSANGTIIAANADNAFDGALLDLQVDGVSHVRVDTSGGMQIPSVKLIGGAVNIGHPVSEFITNGGSSVYVVPAGKVFVMQYARIRGAGSSHVKVDVDATAGPQPQVEIADSFGNNEWDGEIYVPAGGEVELFSGGTGEDVIVHGIEIPESMAPFATATDVIARDGTAASPMNEFDVPAGSILIIINAAAAMSGGNDVIVDTDGGTTLIPMVSGSGGSSEDLDRQWIVADNGSTVEVTASGNASFIGFVIPAP